MADKIDSLLSDIRKRARSKFRKPLSDDAVCAIREVLEEEEKRVRRDDCPCGFQVGEKK